MLSARCRALVCVVVVVVGCTVAVAVAVSAAAAAVLPRFVAGGSRSRSRPVSPASSPASLGVIWGRRSVCRPVPPLSVPRLVSVSCRLSVRFICPFSRAVVSSRLFSTRISPVQLSLPCRALLVTSKLPLLAPQGSTYDPQLPTSQVRRAGPVLALLLCLCGGEGVQPGLRLGGFSRREGFVVALGLLDDVAEEAGVGLCFCGWSADGYTLVAVQLWQSEV